jgi:hypothetical protein
LESDVGAGSISFYSMRFWTNSSNYNLYVYHLSNFNCSSCRNRSDKDPIPILEPFPKPISRQRNKPVQRSRNETRLERQNLKTSRDLSKETGHSKT